MKKILFFILVLYISLSLIGCTSKMTEEEYKDFEAEIQSTMKDVISYIETNLAASEEKIHRYEMANYLEPINEDLEKTIEDAENKIPNSKKRVFESNYSKVGINVTKLRSYLTTNEKQDIEDILAEWKTIINYDEEQDDMAGKVSEPKTFETQVKEYMDENGLSFSWKDIQYDMPNKLDKEFVVAGKAELSDYYNYGFRDTEKDYFVVRITPYDGEYRNTWYLYLHRESFEKLFNSLKEGERAIIATCEIPDYIYKEGQGNMAFVNQIRW